MKEDEKRLLFDALTLSVNKNLDDVVTVLRWASEGTSQNEKLQHIRHAIALLEDVKGSLEELEKD